MQGVKGSGTAMFRLNKAPLGIQWYLSNNFMYNHPHSVAYDLESFETSHHLLVISVRIGKSDHTPVYL